MEREFFALAHQIIRHEEFAVSRASRRHIRGNHYSHALKTAYLCYRFGRRFPVGASPAELVRGALLHDFCAREMANLCTHPRLALENARRLFGELTKTEQDMILRHMFPLTILPPSTRAGWLLWFCDKLAALDDYFCHRR